MAFFLGKPKAADGEAFVTVGRRGCDFNATGSLATPTDHNVIQAAIDSIAESGGQVFIAAGTYYLGSTINITTPNISIVGVGRATQLRCVGDYGNVFFCALPQTPLQWPGMSGLQFSNLRFETTVERTNGAAIRANYTHNAIFRDLYICDTTYGVSFFQPGTYPQAGAAFYNGIHLDGQNQCHISKITSCCVNRCVSINGSGYANADFSYDGYIENCDFFGSPGTRRGIGIYLGANCGGFLIDFVSMNQFEYAIYANAAGTVQGGGIITIRGGYAENTGNHGYFISGYQNTVVEQLWGDLRVDGGNVLVTGVAQGSMQVNNASATIYGNPTSVTGTGTWKIINGKPLFEIKASNFTCVSGGKYMVDTSSSIIQATLPASPVVGDTLEIADARKTWGSNPLSILPNGQQIEGGSSSLTVGASGAFFSLVYSGAIIGWRVLISGVSPIKIDNPVVSGSTTFTATSGAWAGSSQITYQWQISGDGTSGWTNIQGQTSATYNSNPVDAGKYVRILVTAYNGFGQNTAVSDGKIIAAAAPSFPSANLLAFWKLSDALDSSGNANTLTSTGGVGYANGKIGNAAIFSSSSQHLTRNIVNSFKSGAWTFSIWFTRSSLTGAQTIANVGSFGSGLDFYSGPSHGNGLQLYAKGQYEVLGAVVPADTFVHVVLVWNGSSAGQVYFNGQNAGSLTQNPISTASNELRLGGTSCKVDAVGIWTRELSQQEVSTLYNSGSGLEP